MPRRPTVRARLVPTVAAALTVLTLAACSSAPADAPGSVDAGPGGATRTFATPLGDVEIPVAPRRVVATGYAVPVLLEADADLVGVSSWQRGVPLLTPEDRSTYESLPKVAGETAQETDYEAVAALAPDLIVVGVPAPALPELDVDRLRAIAPVVAIGPTHPSDWRQESALQAAAAGRLDHAVGAEATYRAEAARLARKYATVLPGLRFGHLGAAGDVAAGTFLREYADSWGTNIAQDVGVRYTGQVATRRGGAGDVSEQTSIELVGESFAGVDAITVTLDPDGSPSPSVAAVMASPLWQQLPAVRAGRVFLVEHTQAVTYPEAMQTLAALDEALRPLLVGS
jgi:iron complex transport system substrate-binding protein